MDKNKLIDKGANIDLLDVCEYCSLAQTVRCHSLFLTINEIFNERK